MCFHDLQVYFLCNTVREKEIYICGVNVILVTLGNILHWTL